MTCRGRALEQREETPKNNGVREKVFFPAFSRWVLRHNVGANACVT